MRNRLQTLLSQVTRFLTREVWHLDETREKRKQGLLSFVRILLISVEGVFHNRIATQAASLSFFSLIGLGPVLAIGVMISGFIFQETNNDVITNGIDRAIQFIAPPAVEFDKLEQEREKATAAAKEDSDGPVAATVTPETRINPDVVEVIENIIQSSRSGAVGVAGIGVLLMICLQLLTSIENSFNTIWGIKRGRSFQQRLILYWTLITLGFVVLFTFMTIRIAPAVENFTSHIPIFGQLLFSLGLRVSPLFPFFLVALVLGCFFRFIPNTEVRWIPALSGGAFVSVLLYLNNYLSFLYIQRVIVNQSLYGSIGIIPILMLGLYVFWLFILLGGQLTYAIQNVNQLTSVNAWANISSFSKEVVSLAALLEISRRFYRCEPGPTAEALSLQLRIPSQMLNLCMNQLEDAGLISSVETGESDEKRIHRLQPGKPLNKIRLAEVRDQYARQGNNSGADLVIESDPILAALYAAPQSHPEWETDHFEALFKRFPEPSPALEKSPKD
jgi:membrane protein